MPPKIIKVIPMIDFKVGISLKKNHPLIEDHKSIEYSNGDTTAGEAILYAVNVKIKATEAVKPVAIISNKEVSRLPNHS